MTTTLATKTATLNLDTAIECLVHIEATPKTPEVRIVAAQIIDSIEENHPEISAWIDTYFENDNPAKPYVALIQQARAALNV